LIESRPPESIENLLAAAENAEQGLKPMTKAGIRAAIFSPAIRVQFAINRMFRKIGWSLTLKPVVAYLRHRCLNPRDRHTFISFNYDLVLEHAIEEATDRWSPKEGYGVNLRWAAIDDPDEVPGPTLVPLRGRPGGSVMVLKPHGSLNWLAGRGKFRLPFVAVSANGRVRYIGSRATHPYVRLPGRFPTAISVFIVPPTSRKNTDISFLSRIRAKEVSAIEEADEVVVIGWSLPATDSDQVDLIRDAVTKRRKPFKRIVAVNYGADESYYLRVADVFGVRREFVESFNTGLTDFLTRELASAG
jgi:hypothetical protein